MIDYLQRASKTILISIIVVGSVAYVSGLIKDAHEPLAGQTPTVQAELPRNSADDFEDLLDAIEYVESGGDPNAKGDLKDGVYRAIGSFQIWKIYVDDVNRIERIGHTNKYLPPMKWNYRNRQSPYCSRYMVKTYLEHYATEKRIGREPIFEDMARCHNAGPEGWRNDPEWFVRNRGYSLEHAKDKIANAKAYWEKVKARLEGE